MAVLSTVCTGLGTGTGSGTGPRVPGTGCGGLAPMRCAHAHNIDSVIGSRI